MAEEYKARYKGVKGAARLIKRTLERHVGASSGMAASAGRAVSGRQRQLDSIVDEAVRGGSERQSEYPRGR